MSPEAILAASLGFLAGYFVCALTVVWAVSESLERLQRDSRPSDGGVPWNVGASTSNRGCDGGEP